MSQTGRLPAHGLLVGPRFLAGLYLLYLAGCVAHHLLHVLQALHTDFRGPGHRLQYLLVTTLHQGEHAIHSTENTERYGGRFFWNNLKEIQIVIFLYPLISLFLGSWWCQSWVSQPDFNLKVGFATIFMRKKCTEFSSTKYDQTGQSNWLSYRVIFSLLKTKILRILNKLVLYWQFCFWCEECQENIRRWVTDTFKSSRNSLILAERECSRLRLQRR